MGDAVGTKRRREEEEAAPAPLFKRRREDEAGRHRRALPEDKDEREDRREDRHEGRREDKKAKKRSATRRALQLHTPEAEEALAYFMQMHKAEAEAVVEAEPEGPDEAEVDAMHAFSVELLKIRDKEEATKAKTAPMKAAAKDLRQRLYAWMVDEEKDIVAIPKALYDVRNTQIEAAGMATLPPYIRVFENNKDATIQAETVRTAISKVTVADVQEVLVNSKKPIGVTQAFFVAVVNEVRRAIREYTKQVKQLPSLPRGTRATEVEDAPTEVAEWAIRLHTNEQGSKMMEGRRKGDDAKRQTNLRLLEPLVASYFARSGLITESGNASQRVVLGGVPYRLVRRVTTVKQSIRFGTIERALWAGVGAAWGLDVPTELAGGKGDDDEEMGEEEEEPKRGAKTKKGDTKVPDPVHSLEELTKLLETRRTDLLDTVTKTLNTLPPTKTTSIKLYNTQRPKIKAPE